MCVSSHAWIRLFMFYFGIIIEGPLLTKKEHAVGVAVGSRNMRWEWRLKQVLNNGLDNVRGSGTERPWEGLKQVLNKHRPAASTPEGVRIKTENQPTRPQIGSPNDLLAGAEAPRGASVFFLLHRSSFILHP